MKALGIDADKVTRLSLGVSAITGTELTVTFLVRSEDVKTQALMEVLKRYKLVERDEH